METTEKTPPEVQAVLDTLEEDLNAAAQVYGIKHGSDQKAAQAFADGAQWMLARMPQFADATICAWRRVRD